MANFFRRYQQNFAERSEWSYDLSDLYAFYDSVELLTQYLELLFPGKIYNVDYKDIIEKQGKESIKLIDYYELDWDDACLSFDKKQKKSDERKCVSSIATNL